MLPDRWGSDADYDAAHGNDWSLDVSRDDWCDEHQQRGTTCGPCHAAGTLTEAEAAWLRDFKAALDGEKHRQTADADEDTGAGLAARFGEGA